MAENSLQRAWVVLDRLPHHLELGKRGQGLKRFGSLRSLSALPCVSAVLRRDAVEQVLDCPLGVVVGGSEGGDALLPRESHGHELVDLRLILLVFRRLGRFLLLLGLGLFFLLGLGDGDFYFFFNFGFGLRLLRKRGCTATWVMTTRKSVSLSPSFSIFSSLLVVLPLKMIFCDSTGCPFSSLILSLRSAI